MISSLLPLLLLLLLALLLLQVADAYLKCLKQHARDAVACQQLAKQYLQCRMDR
jgi:hypothetical protein